MQFVLESVLNLTLHILGDVASVSDVSDACQRDRDHELVTEGWQILLKTSDNEGVGVGGEFSVKCLIELKGEFGVMIWAEVGAVFSALDLVAVYKVQVSGEHGKPLLLEVGRAILALLDNFPHHLQLLFPGPMSTIKQNYSLNQVLDRNRCPSHFSCRFLCLFLQRNWCFGK